MSRRAGSCSPRRGDGEVRRNAGLRTVTHARQRGAARPVDDEVWPLGLGPTGASLVLDDLREFLG
jgi:iron complex transport system substrate-binding protein